MKKIRKVVDERQELELYKIEHVCFFPRVLLRKSLGAEQTKQLSFGCNHCWHEVDNQ